MKFKFFVLRPKTQFSKTVDGQSPPICVAVKKCEQNLLLDKISRHHHVVRERIELNHKYR